jgi:catechol 2,3-dioxygenase-like lactoylglutathione lyase family enzyme
MNRGPHRATPIVPCNDLDASTRFYARLGYREAMPSAPGRAEYRVLEDGRGGELHLQVAVPGWVVPGRNPFGVYLHLRQVRAIAAAFGRPLQETPYGALETTLSDPDETLVRVGWSIPRRRAGPPARRRRTAPRRARRAQR